MNRRLTMAITAGALVAAIVPGVAAAAPLRASVEGVCLSTLPFGHSQFLSLSTDAGISFGEIRSRFLEFERKCFTSDSYGNLYVNDELFDSFLNS